MGITERINDLLGSYCSGGYGNGDIGQANYNFLKKEFGDVSWLWFGSVYRLGDTVRFQAPVEDSRRFGEFVELLSGLDSYPLLDEDLYSEMIWELEDEEWQNLVTEYNLDWEYVNQIRNDNEYYFSNEDGMATLYGMTANFDVDKFVEQVRELQQTWMVHYYSGMVHTPDLCHYCLESQVA